MMGFMAMLLVELCCPARPPGSKPGQTGARRRTPADQRPGRTRNDSNPGPPPPGKGDERKATEQAGAGGAPKAATEGACSAERSVA